MRLDPRLAPALAVLTGCGGPSGPRITLRFHPPAGAAYSYALEQHNAMRVEGGPLSRMPAQQFTMHMYFTQAVDGPTDGGIGVTVKFDSTTMDSQMMTPDAMQPVLDRMRGIKSHIVYDDRMNVVKAEIEGVAGTPSPLTEQLGRSVKNMAFPLPERPVGVGDSWTTETELPLGQVVSASQPIKATSRMTVKEIRVAGGDTTVVMAVETTFPRAPVTVTQRGQNSTLTFSGTLAGERLFSVTKGAAVGSTMGGTMKITVANAQTGAAGMTIAMDQKTSLQLTGGK